MYKGDKKMPNYTLHGTGNSVKTAEKDLEKKVKVANKKLDKAGNNLLGEVDSSEYRLDYILDGTFISEESFVAAMEEATAFYEEEEPKIKEANITQTYTVSRAQLKSLRTEKRKRPSSALLEPAGHKDITSYLTK